MAGCINNFKMEWISGTEKLVEKGLPLMMNVKKKEGFGFPLSEKTYVIRFRLLPSILLVTSLTIPLTITLSNN